MEEEAPGNLNSRRWGWKGSLADGVPGGVFASYSRESPQFSPMLFPKHQNKPYRFFFTFASGPKSHRGSLRSSKALRKCFGWVFAIS